MNDIKNSELTQILVEIRDNQLLQIERQAEALALQKEQFELTKEQFERTKKLQEKTELLQDKSSKFIDGNRRFFLVIFAIATVLLVVSAIFNVLGI